jgi:hypothetical protein
MAAIETISKSRLPADMKDRDRFVGVRVIRSGPKGQYFQARFSISKALLADFGKPNRVSLRGTPQNGYIITAGDDFKPTIMENASVVYLNISAEPAFRRPFQTGFGRVSDLESPGRGSKKRGAKSRRTYRLASYRGPAGDNAPPDLPGPEAP